MSDVRGEAFTSQVQGAEENFMGRGEPIFAKYVRGEVNTHSRYSFDEATGRWRQLQETAVGEATLMVGGPILYDHVIEEQSRVGHSFEFGSLFAQLAHCIGKSDLAIGSLGALVSPSSPPMSVMTHTLAGGHYYNAQPEFLDGLRVAGFDCLTLANPYNLDAGRNGIAETESSVREHAIVPSGIGIEREPIFRVNGIDIAVLSFTMDVYAPFVEEVPAVLRESVNYFSPERAQESIERVRAAGADFVLCYLDCRSATNGYGHDRRLALSQNLADFGADYVVCIKAFGPTAYHSYFASDGRRVPIATSLGVLVSGGVTQGTAESAIMKITLRSRPDADGVDIEDSFIPILRQASGSVPLPVPAHSFYVRPKPQWNFRATADRLSKKLRNEITLDRSRRTTVFSHYHPQLTPLDIARIIGGRLSRRDKKLLANAKNRPVTCISAVTEDLVKGCAAVITGPQTPPNRSLKISAEQARLKGAAVAIAESPIPGIPTVVTSNPWQAYLNLLHTIRDRYTPKTFAVTGTVGKTTSKDMLGHVLNRHFRTLHVIGNGNTTVRVGGAIQKLDPSVEAYVQEVHEGSPGVSSLISSLVRPDICLITSISEGHLGQMGTMEKVVEGVMQVTDGMPDDGTLIINNDSQLLRETHTRFATVRYSINDSGCDYFARNIEDTGEKLHFQIVSPAGEYDATLNFQGLHNVSNAVGVFAAAHIGGVPPQLIIAGLSRYRPESVRQHLLEWGGYRILLDTYSATPSSVISAVQTLQGISVPSGSRRIVVLSAIPDLGATSVQNHREVGEAIAALDFDLLLCSGGNSKHIVESAARFGKKAYYFEERLDLNRMISATISPGDLILFKGGTRAKLLERTVLPVFGKIA